MNTPKSETPEVDALLDEHGKLLSNTLKYPTEQALIWLSRKLERERDALLKAAKAVKYKDLRIEGDEYAPRTWRTERVLEGLDELHKLIASIEAKDRP